MLRSIHLVLLFSQFLWLVDAKKSIVVTLGKLNHLTKTEAVCSRSNICCVNPSGVTLGGLRRLRSSQAASSMLHKCVYKCVFVSARDRDHSRPAHMILGLGISRWLRGKCMSVWETQSRRQWVWENALGFYTIASPLPVSQKNSVGHAWSPRMHTRTYIYRDTHTHCLIKPSVNIYHN